MPFNPHKVPTLPPALDRVCPILTLAAPRKEPSALVGGNPTTIGTVNCLGMRCEFFHPIGHCSVLVGFDSLLTQASILRAQVDSISNSAPDEDVPEAKE